MYHKYILHIIHIYAYFNYAEMTRRLDGKSTLHKFVYCSTCSTAIMYFQIIKGNYAMNYVIILIESITNWRKTNNTIKQHARHQIY